MHSRIELGSFALQRAIGEGGMGEVWLSTSTTTRTDAAIKVISAQLIHAHGNQYDQQFVQEVNAVAKLNHANICRIFDFGYISADADAASQGRLKEGSPWFAMEYAQGGTLENLQRIQDWTTLKDCLSQLLQGLAHAHARGLIHRDIKPGNVLVCTAYEHPRYVLTDFGLALPLDMQEQEDDALSKPTGTPYYMPPEQFAGQWRDYGPWTDLYALGCMAYELSCKDPPFTGANLVTLAMKHTQDEMPKLAPAFAVPEAFDTWLRTLSAKNPANRFTRAADALWALQALPQTPIIHPSTAIATEPLAIDSMADTIDTTLLTPPDNTTQRFDPQALMRISQTDQHATPTRQTPASHLHQERPPLPTTWQTKDSSSPCTHLIGAGLFAMRTTPFVGRTPERDLIWQTLTQTIRMSTPTLLTITGHSGTGKSRLAQWMTQRIEELGAARCIHIHHDQRPGPTHGVGYAFERMMHCRGLSSEEAVQRVFQWLSNRTGSQTPHGLLQHTARSIVAMMDAKHAHLANFSNENERYAALVLVLSILSQERPVVL